MNVYFSTSWRRSSAALQYLVFQGRIIPHTDSTWNLLEATDFRENWHDKYDSAAALPENVDVFFAYKLYYFIKSERKKRLLLNFNPLHFQKLTSGFTLSWKNGSHRIIFPMANSWAAFLQWTRLTLEEKENCIMPDRVQMPCLFPQ